MSIRAKVARRERAHENVRRDILLAAAQVFARRGYAAATLADLAEAAGFAAPSLYRYFESKQEIFRCLIELVTREITDTFAASPNRDRPLAERLETLLRAQFELVQRYREFFASMLAAPGAVPVCTVGNRRYEGPDSGLAFYQQDLAQWLGREARPGELRSAPEDAALAMAGIAHVFMLRQTVEAADPAVQAKLVTELALHGIAASGATRSWSRGKRS